MVDARLTTPFKARPAILEPCLRWAVPLLALASIVPAVGCGRQPAIHREAGLNVLLVTIDTLRADAVGAYGSRRGATPLIDRIASGGVRFAKAHAQNVVT